MSLVDFLLKESLSNNKRVVFKVKPTTSSSRYSYSSPFKGKVLGHRASMKNDLIKFLEELKKNSNARNEVNLSTDEIGRRLNLGSGASQYRAKLLIKYNVIEFFTLNEKPSRFKSIRILDENFDFDNLNMRVYKNAK